MTTRSRRSAGAVVLTVLLLAGVCGLALTAPAGAVDHDEDATVTVDDLEVQPDQTVTAEVNVSGADGGLSGFVLTLELSRPDVAAVEDVRAGDGFEVTETRVSGGGAEIVISGADVEKTVESGGEIRLAELQLRGAELGRTEIDVASVRLDDEEGEQIRTETESGQLTVTESPVLTVEEDGSGDFRSISAAVARAKDGFTIQVGLGTYEESVVVDKDVTIEGESRSFVEIVPPSRTEAPITIPAEGSPEPTIRGVTLGPDEATSIQVGIDARGADGDWTVANVAIPAVSMASIDARRSSGDWTVRDSETRTINAGQSSGDWTVDDNKFVGEPFEPRFAVVANGTTGDWTVRDSNFVRGNIDANVDAGAPLIDENDLGRRYIDARDANVLVDARVNEFIGGEPNEGQCRGLVDCGQRTTDRLIVAADGSGDYERLSNAVAASHDETEIIVRNGTYEESVRIDRDLTITADPEAVLLGSNLAAETGITIAPARAPTIDGLDVRGFETGIEAATERGESADWTVRNLRIQRVSGGIDAYRTNGDWRVENVSITGFEGASRTTTFGLSAVAASGDWEVAELTVDGAERGLWADISGGNWRTTDSRFTSNEAGVLARGTTGGWSVFGSEFRNNTDAAINATKARPTGTTAGNDWGPDGYTAGQCVGNVECADMNPGDDEDAPEGIRDVIEAVFDAGLDGDIDRLGTLAYPESPAVEQLEERQGDEAPDGGELLAFERLSATDERAFAQTREEYRDDRFEEGVLRQEWVYELRRLDGAWRVYDVVPAAEFDRDRLDELRGGPEGQTVYELTVYDESGAVVGSTTVRDNASLSAYGEHLAFDVIGDTAGDGDHGIVDNIRVNGETVEDWSNLTLDAYTQTRESRDRAEFNLVQEPTTSGPLALELFSGQTPAVYTSEEPRLSIENGTTIRGDIRHETDNSDSYALKTGFDVGTNEDGDGGISLQLVNPGTQRTPGAQITTRNGSSAIEFTPTVGEFYTFELDVYAANSSEEGDSFEGERIELPDWETTTSGDADATVVGTDALDLRVFKCSRATARTSLGEIEGEIQLAFDWTVDAEQWHERPLVLVYEDGERIFRSNESTQVGFRREAYTVTNGTARATVPVDGTVSLAVRVVPSGFCERYDHANTFFRIRNLTVKVAR